MPEKKMTVEELPEAIKDLQREVSIVGKMMALENGKLRARIELLEAFIRGDGLGYADDSEGKSALDQILEHETLEETIVQTIAQRFHVSVSAELMSDER